MRVVGAFAILIAIALGAVPAAAGNNYIVAGASPGGLWSLLGAGIERAVKADDPEAAVTYQASAGGFANVQLVSRGDVDLGIVHNAELKLAAQGEAPFARPYPQLRAIAVLYDFALLHPLVTEAFAERYGVRSIAEIRESQAPLRVVINRPGNIARDVAERLLAAHGLTTEAIEAAGGTVHTSGSRGAVKLVKGRQADMITNIVFVGHSAIRELAAAMPMRLLQCDDAALESVAAEFGIAIRTIPAGAYDWLDRDVRTLSLSAVLVADAGMDDDRAYRVTKALIGNLERFRSVHKSMDQVTPAMMGSLTTIPYHPGALRAFREAGIDMPGQ